VYQALLKAVVLGASSSRLLGTQATVLEIAGARCVRAAAAQVTGLCTLLRPAAGSHYTGKRRAWWQHCSRLAGQWLTLVCFLLYSSCAAKAQRRTGGLQSLCTTTVHRESAGVCAYQVQPLQYALGLLAAREANPCFTYLDCSIQTLCCVGWNAAAALSGAVVAAVFAADLLLTRWAVTDTGHTGPHTRPGQGAGGEGRGGGDSADGGGGWGWQAATMDDIRGRDRVECQMGWGVCRKRGGCARLCLQFLCNNGGGGGDGAGFAIKYRCAPHPASLRLSD
jgi:hypothetical protein